MARLARMTAAEYPNDNYVCLDRQFYDVDLKTADGTNYILAQQLVGDKIRWSDLTSRHRVVVQAPAGVGKTAEFRAAANNQLRAGHLLSLAAQLRSYADEADSIRAELDETFKLLRQTPSSLLGDYTSESDERIGSDYDTSIPLIGVSSEEGLTTPKTPIGKSPERYKILRANYLAYNPMRINIGSIGVVRNPSQEGITSPDYVVFYCDPRLLPEYLYHFLRSEADQHEINLKTKGSVRFRLYYEQLARISIPVPSDIETQQRFVNACNRLEDLRRMVSAAADAVGDCLNAATRTAFLPDQAVSELEGAPLRSRQNEEGRAVRTRKQAGR
jgi:hypothetical protein